MAHFARLNTDNIVTEVEVVSNDVATTEQLGINFLKTVHKTDDTFVQTSYNNNIRKNYAAIGYSYDQSRDAFIAPTPFGSWILNETTCQWEAPVALPDTEKRYNWNEKTQQWDLNE